MANQLKMAQQQTILTLAERGWSQRRIADELGVNRETVARYVQLARTAAANPAISITGSAVELSASDGPGPDPPVSNPAISITGSAGRRSRCEPLRAIILAKLEQGLSAQRIWQDLTAEHDFADSYQSVQRFVRTLRSATLLPFRRMECAPGEEAQVDFGRGAPIITADGKRKRPHLFRIVLSCSRKAYSEVVLRQTTEEFLRCLENAFRHFGGVPKTLVPDNLKAAVIQADWYDPQLNPKLLAFCQHYGTVCLPTKPRTPRHKGKVERGVGYAQSNALKGRTFTSLAEQNRFLVEWEATVADTRIHGTTRKQVGPFFTEVEQPALLPLPIERFPFFHEAQRIVSRDGHVEVAKAYYSVPPEHLGRSGVHGSHRLRQNTTFYKRCRDLPVDAERTYIHNSQQVRLNSWPISETIMRKVKGLGFASSLIFLAAMSLGFLAPPGDQKPHMRDNPVGPECPGCAPNSALTATCNQCGGAQKTVGTNCDICCDGASCLLKGAAGGGTRK